MLDMLELFFGLLSFLFISFIAYFAWKNRAVTSCPQLFLTCCMVLEWTVCVWLECMSPFGGWQKLIWLLLSQIGAFYAVPAFLSYVLEYTGFRIPPLKHFVTGIYVWQTIALGIVLTNPLHQFIFGMEDLKVDAFGQLLFRLTLFGNFLVLLNYVINIFALGLLVVFYARVKDGLRAQVRAVVLAASVFVLYAFLRQLQPSARDILPPLPLMLFVVALIGMYAIWRYDLVELTPLAYQEIFEVIDEGVIIFGMDGEVVGFNRAIREMIGLHFRSKGTLQNDYAGRRRLQRVIEEHYPDWQGDGSGYNQFDTHLENNGQGYDYHCRVYPFHNLSGRAIGLILVIRDMTVEYNQTRILQEQVEKDGLTGIYNRQTFTRMVEQRLQLGIGPWSLMYFDLDHFKCINDTYGHMFGDQVLCETCSTIAGVLSKETLFCRAGGEEFMVFLQGCDAVRAHEMAETLRKAVADHAFVYNGVRAPVTISVGAVTAATYTFDDYYRYADRMLYKAKEEGRNCVRVWNEGEDLQEYKMTEATD